MSIDLSGHTSWMALVLQNMGNHQGREAGKQIELQADLDENLAWLLNHEPLKDPKVDAKGWQAVTNFFTRGCKTVDPGTNKKEREAVNQRNEDIQQHAESYDRAALQLNQLVNTSKDFLKHIDRDEGSPPPVQDGKPDIIPVEEKKPEDKKS